jgi:hypothetical protein
MHHFPWRYTLLRFLLSTCVLGVWAKAQVDPLTRYQPTGSQPTNHQANDMHANDTHANDMHANDMHANDLQRRSSHARHQAGHQARAQQEQQEQRIDAWTLQVGQYHDERRARTQVTRLRQLGFDAYLEPSLAGLLRVRVGCFLSPETARTMVSLLQGRVDAVMVLTPLNVSLSVEANVQVCTEQQTGFITPAAWGIQQVSPQGVVFWIQLAGQTGYVVYHEGWHVSQDEPRLLEQSLAESSASQAAFAMTSLVAADASLPSVAVVRYQLADAAAKNTEAARDAELAMLEGTDASVDVAAENIGTENTATENTAAGNMGTGNRDTENNLAAALARLPKRPRVSLHTAEHTADDTVTAANAMTEATTEATIAVMVDATSASQHVNHATIVSSGDILWQNDHNVVVYQQGGQQQGGQQQGRLVSLRVVPVSSLRTAWETAHD